MNVAGGDLCGSVLAEILLVVVFLPELLAVLGIGSGVFPIVSGVSAIRRSGVFLDGILRSGAVCSGVSAILVFLDGILRSGAVCAV